MNILLTNDDGYNSKGIQILKELLSKYATVIIVAPDSPRSGSSASLTIHEPLKLIKVEEGIYKCSGTPVDCVALGLECFNIDFDLVVSGCNNGLNISYDTMYSGTVGAALEALIFRKPAIAVSSPWSQEEQFENVINWFDRVWAFLTENELISKEYILNINFPKDAAREYKLGGLYYRNDEHLFIEENGSYFTKRHLQLDYSDQPESDCFQVEHGIISIVPLAKSYYNPSIKEELEKKINE